MSGILVFAEHEGGQFKKTAFEILGKASELAPALGLELMAVVLGDAPAADLGAYGATKVFQVPGDFATYDTDKVVAGIRAVIGEVDPDVFLAASAYAGKDAIPRLVAATDGAQASDITDLRLDGGELVARRPVYSGKAFVDVRLSRKPAFFTIRPNSFGKPEAGTGTAEVVELAVDLGTPRITVVETLVPETEIVDLTEADLIVSGGRAMKNKENFDAVIRPLAASLGATPGASRAAVDAGYAPHSDQVGQTGKTVNPQVYIACGISGAIQHLAGMRTSKVIVAINKDPEAPIFKVATYGIVGDLFQIVPALAEQVKAKVRA